MFFRANKTLMIKPTLLLQLIFIWLLILSQVLLNLNSGYAQINTQGMLVYLPCDASEGNSLIPNRGTMAINCTLVSTSYVQDINGRTGGAIKLNPSPASPPDGGRIWFPSGSYFNGDGGTIAGWVFINNRTQWMRFLDFGNGAAAYNIVAGLNSAITGHPFFDFHKDFTVRGLNLGQVAPIGQWFHMAYTYERVGSNVSVAIYINGFPSSTGTVPVSILPDGRVTNDNFIGRSNWAPFGEASSDMHVDEIYIFNRALSMTEVNTLRNNVYNTTPTITASATNLCIAGQPITLSVQNPRTDGTYLWSTGATGNSINVSQAGDYWVEFIFNNGPRFRSSTTTITDSRPASPIINGDFTNRCIGDIVPISISSSNSNIINYPIFRGSNQFATKALISFVSGEGRQSFYPRIVLNNAGLDRATNILGFRLRMNNTLGIPHPINNIRIRMIETTESQIPVTPISSGYTEVANISSITLQEGTTDITFNFSTPFAYTNTRNLIIDVCATNGISGDEMFTAEVFNSGRNGSASYENCSNGEITDLRTVFVPAIELITQDPIQLNWGSFEGGTVQINGLNANFRITASSGSVSAVATQNGCSSETTRTFTANPRPGVVEVVTSNPVCSSFSASATFSAPNATSFRFYTSETGSVTTPVMFADNGQTTFWVAGVNGSCEGPRTPYTVPTILSEPLSISVQGGGNPQICNNTAITLTSPLNGDHFWRRNGNFLGLFQNTLTVTEPGSYTAIALQGTNGCSTLVSNAINVTIGCPAASNDFVWLGGSINPGGWNDPANWQNNQVPPSRARVTINSSFTAILDRPLSLEKVTITPGSTFIVDEGVSLNLDTLQNEGSFSVLGTIFLRRNNRLGNTGLIYNLETAFGTQITLDTDLNIVNSVVLGLNSSLDLNHKKLSLLSFNGNTAQLGPMFGLSSLLNAENFEVNRQLNPDDMDNNGAWFFVGSAVQGTRVNNYATNNPFAAGTFNNSIPANSSVWLYDPSSTTFMQNNGFVKPTGPEQILRAGEGARIWFRRNPFMNNLGIISTQGRPNSGQINFTPLLKVCDANCPYLEGNNFVQNRNGWNLIANPYPCPINWDTPALGGLMRVNIANAVYTYDSKNRRYRSYVMGVGINGGSNIIPSSEAFFINVLDHGASLIMDERVKVLTNLMPGGITALPTNVLKVSLAVGNNEVDEIAIRQHNEATLEYDSQLDATSMSGSSADNISTITPAGNRLGIDSRALSSELDSVNLNVRLTSGAMGKLVFRHAESFSGKRLYLKDKFLNTLTPIAEGTEYSFEQSASNTNRFSIVFQNNSVAALAIKDNVGIRVFPNPANDQISVALPIEDLTEIRISNMVGQIVKSFNTTSSLTIDIQELKSGVYWLETNHGHKQKFVKR